jgi:two-component system, sensor histidine kinase and response regulator
MSAIKNSILIVDDNKENIKVLGLALKEKNYNLIVAFSGKNALEILDLTPIDLVLLDVMMPEMDGFEACSRMKANPKTKDIPVIFITALTELDNIVRGFEVGGVDYITKPFKSNELFARVQTQLEIRNQRLKLEEQTLELKETIETRDKLYSLIAHDLRSPLANIKSILTALSNQDIDEGSFKELVTALQKTTNETFDLLENLLLWSRNKLSKLSPQKTTFSLNQVITETAELLKTNAMQKSIRVETVISKPVDIHADKNMISTVIRNLGSNAIKFTQKGGIIKIESEAKSDCIQISVTDNGVGISPGNLSNLFGRDGFYTTYGTEQEKGSGLGLKLVLDFVNYHNGNIDVESEEGVGSKFTVTLPLTS